MASSLLNFLVSVAIILIVSGLADAQGLKVGFYKKTCPNAEAIVRQEMNYVIKVAPSLSGPLLRMHFHDCFIRGCDASVLLNSTSNNAAEKSGVPNISLRGYQIIDRIKAKLEKACPGIVSCADIVAVVARDAVALTHGPSWQVPTGRRDGRVSKATESFNLPAPFANINQAKAAFSQNGLTTKDLVVLSGAHTLGTSSCASFRNRIYNFTGKGDADRTFDPNYVIRLKRKCKSSDLTSLVEMDPGSSKTFDTGYYKQVSKRRGLFQSDEALLHDSVTKAYVQKMAVATNPSEFFKDFAESMVKMSQIGVLTGTQGEIRKQCSVTN